MGKTKPFDYLFLATRVKSLEGRLLNRGRMERMLEAGSHQAALEVLLECGYPAVPDPVLGAIEESLAQQRREVLEDLAAFAPDPAVVDLFRLRFDYHNLKVLLKAQALGTDPAPLLLPGGRVPPDQLRECLRAGELAQLPYLYREAVEQGRQALSATGDPQRMEFVLDRAYFQEMSALAQDSGSGFLQGYVRLSIDAANLRALLRCLRMGKGEAFLREVLVPGGEVEPSRLLVLSGSGRLAEGYAGFLAHAAQEADGIRQGGAMTRFEKACDDAVTAYLSQAKYIAFGDAPVAAYLAAKENEWTAIRVIMSGRLAGLSKETIRERLREAYV